MGPEPPLARPPHRGDAGRHALPAPRHVDPTSHTPGPPGYDPLAGVRAPGDPAFDVFCSGTVFLDIVFTGLQAPPAPGAEVWTEGMGSSPGGIANLAVATTRLGLRTALAAAFGGDVYGDFCWEVLAAQEGIDLCASQRYPGWHSPVTASLAYQGDRSMVTHGHAPPGDVDAIVLDPPQTRACVVAVTGERPPWVGRAVRAGSLLFADVGWDQTGSWDLPELALGDCHCFWPNAVEAMRYTQTSSPVEALDHLAARVPIAVVTCGRAGALAVDNLSGERSDEPGLAVPALDPTGAGDVFGAAFLLGTLAQWPLQQRLRFANLAAALSVAHFGGSLSAPGWADIAAWWEAVRAADVSPELVSAYGFLDDVLPGELPSEVQRATATVGLRPTDRAGR